jgi:hypothetical protein
VANGAVSNLRDQLPADYPYPYHQVDQLFRNLGNGTFAEIAGFDYSAVSRGAIFGDLDNDGDTDIVVVDNSGPLRILENRIGQETNWIGLRMVGKSGGDMLGTRVAVIVGGKPPLWRRARTDGSYAAANDPRVLVGVGEATDVLEVIAIWPDGSRETWTGLAVNRYHVLIAGSGEASLSPVGEEE